MMGCMRQRHKQADVMLMRLSLIERQKCDLSTFRMRQFIASRPAVGSFATPHVSPLQFIRRTSTNHLLGNIMTHDCLTCTSLIRPRGLLRRHQDVYLHLRIRQNSVTMTCETSWRRLAWARTVLAWTSGSLQSMVAHLKHLGPTYKRRVDMMNLAFFPHIILNTEVTYHQHRLPSPNPPQSPPTTS